MNMSKAILSPGMLRALSAMTIFLILSGHLIWWIERKSNSKNFPDSYLDGVDDGIWWLIVTMTTGAIMFLTHRVYGRSDECLISCMPFHGFANPGLLTSICCSGIWR